MTGDQPTVVVLGDVVIDRFTEDLTETQTWRHRSTYGTNDEVQPGGAWRTADALHRMGARVELATATPASGFSAPWTVTDLAPGSSRPPVERLWVRHRGELLQVNSNDHYGRWVEDGAVTVQHPDPDLIVVQDYGHGSAAAVMTWLTAQVESGVPVVWDGHPLGPPLVPGAVAVMDRSRFAWESGEPCAEVGGTARAMSLWRLKNGASGLVLTLGTSGCLISHHELGEAYACTAFEADRKQIGAGDAFTGSLGAQLLVQPDLRAASMAALSTTSRILAENTGHADFAHSDSRPTIDRVADVVTSGCFDLLHLGHGSLLTACRRLGRRVTVLLNDDDSVQRLKGPGRPFDGFDKRRDALLETGLVDRVVGFSGDTPAEALRGVDVDIYVKGADYDIRSIPESAVVESRGGWVLTIPFVSAVSTTSIHERVIGRGAT